MTNTGFMSHEQLEALGLRHIGEAVQVDQTVRFYGASRISLEAHCRVDAFSVVSAGAGGINIGPYVHVGAFGFLGGAGAIELQEFSGISGRVSIYSSSDDFDGFAMAHPTIPDEFRKVHSAPVTLMPHALVGAGSVILPGVTLATGAVVGALSVIARDVPEFTMVVGTGRVLRTRRRDLLELEQRLRTELLGEEA